MFLGYIIINYWNEILLNFEKFSFWAFPDNPSKNGETIKLSLSLFGGIALLWGLYASLKRAKASSDGIKLQSKSIDNQSEQIELSRTAQVNNQFKSAIEHLSSDKDAIVLGGVTELHFIASENPNRFREVVLNILVNKFQSEAKIFKDAEDINFTIIQTIFNYFFRSEVYYNLDIDLGHCNLSSLDISNVSMKNVNLSFCLMPSDITNCKFDNVDLGKSCSVISRFNDVIFNECNLNQAFFKYAKFKNVTINNTKDTNNIICLSSHFYDSNLNGDFHASYFLGCKFFGTKLLNESMININFSASGLYDMNFAETEFFKCNFSACQIHNVNIDNIIMQSVFDGAENKKEEYGMIFEDQVQSRIGEKEDLSGLTAHNINYSKGSNSISELTKDDAEKLILLYKELEKKYYPDRKNNKDKKNTSN